MSIKYFPYLEQDESKEVDIWFIREGSGDYNFFAFLDYHVFIGFSCLYLCFYVLKWFLDVKVSLAPTRSVRW